MAGYNYSALRGDMLAGLNVALLAFPQGMAYAMIAGLPIEYGIYGSAVASIVGGIFAGSRFVTLGPTNATAVLLASAFAAVGIASEEARAAMTPTILVLTGVFILAGAFFGVAKFIQYISRTVITGYITAAAMLITSGQLPKVFGFSIESGASTFVEKLVQLAMHFGELHHECLVLSLLTAALYLLLNHFKATKKLPKVAITMVVMSAIAGLLDHYVPLTHWWNTAHLDFLNGIDATMWPIGAGGLELHAFGELATPALAISLLCVLEGASIGKDLAARAGKRLNTDQEMLGTGAANIGCAFMGGMPASGSLTRSALSWASGCHTQLASIFSGLFVTAGAFAFGSLTAYIPKSVLATLIIVTVVSLYNRRAIRIVTHTTVDDRRVFWVTFAGGLLFPLDTAIYMGTGLSILLFLRRAAAPELVEYGLNEEGMLTAKPAAAVESSKSALSIIHAEGDLFFGSAEFINDQIRLLADDPSLKIIVCKMRNARHVDATTVMALEDLVKYMNEHGRFLIISEVRPDVMKALEDSGLREFLDGEHGEPFVFADTPENPTLSTAKALKRAKELIGEKDAEVRIYVNPKRQQREGKETN